ncbi:DNA-deoxyinosine glycosylase [Paenibacillus chitinolyticus]|uniref:DNA-deoxyinosine glycosylase n=1 Tax=Paenibacillus chitinolyticus TaxID=79263 RepID=UPI003556CA34
MLCMGFEPVIAPDSVVLILGSMPGELSLERQEYYGNPRNDFWRLLASLHGEDHVPDTYEERLRFALGRKIALWDVLASCEREGSLDANIREPAVNDFDALFAEYPSLRTVLFNGAASEKLFRKHAGHLLADSRLGFVRLPSSSPANAMGWERKLAAWREAWQGVTGRREA